MIQHGQIADHGREVNREGPLVLGFQVVVRAVGGTGDAAADGHPPGRGVGEGIDLVGAQADGLAQHPSLAGIGAPIPGVALWLKSRGPARGTASSQAAPGSRRRRCCIARYSGATGQRPAGRMLHDSCIRPPRAPTSTGTCPSRRISAPAPAWLDPGSDRCARARTFAPQVRCAGREASKQTQGGAKKAQAHAKRYWPGVGTSGKGNGPNSYFSGPRRRGELSTSSHSTARPQ